MTKVKVVTVRKSHACRACGGEIPIGDQAFVATTWESQDARYPTTRYFHADDGDPQRITKISFNQIRQEICSKKVKGEVPSEEQALDDKENREQDAEKEKELMERYVIPLPEEYL